MDQLIVRSLSRRRALLSIATLAGTTFLKPASVFGVESVKNRLQFAVLGDWGTGDGSEGDIAGQMMRAHAASPLDFVIAAGDNIYPDGGGRRFGKSFKQPCGDTDLKSPLRAMSFDEDNHFMRVEIDDRQISYQAVTRSGLVIDSGDIKGALS